MVYESSNELESNKRLVPLIDVISEGVRERNSPGVYDKEVNVGVSRSPSKLIRE